MTKKQRFVSLRIKTLIILVVTILIAAATFWAVRELGNFFVWRYYLEETTAQEREEKHIQKLQDYVTEQKLTTSDTDRVLSWSEGRFADVVIYQNSELIYSPEWFEDFDPEAPQGSFKESEFYESWFSGDRGFEKYLTEEARNKYRDTLDNILAGTQELHPIYCVDGTLLVTFVDYSEKGAQNLVLAIAFISALAVISLSIVINMSHMAKRVNKLAQDVKLVEGGDLEAPIVIEGNDDITSLARDIDSMRNALIENMEKERHAWESNSALITAMSHDIRTPLTVLMGYLDLIELSDKEDANAEYVAVCRENAERLKKLSDDMFSYFLVFGKQDMQLNRQTVSLSGEISGMIAEHAFLLEEKGYAITHTRELPELYVSVDLMYFSRVIDNIFSNIGKYADSSSPVTVDVRQENDSVALLFTNKVRRDKSIPESNRIGLKTCSKILEQMGGELIVTELEDTFEIAVKLTVEALNDSSANT